MRRTSKSQYRKSDSFHACGGPSELKTAKKTFFYVAASFERSTLRFAVYMSYIYNFVFKMLSDGTFNVRWELEVLKGKMVKNTTKKCDILA